MIKRIQKQIGFTVAVFAFILATIACVNFAFIRKYTIGQILGEPSVSVVIVAGIAVLLTGIFRNRTTRTIQVVLFYLMGLLPGFDAVSGNLTSAIFIGFSYILLVEYHLLERWRIPKLIAFFGIYFASVVYGFARNTEVPLIASIHTILGIALALYLFYIMIDIRTIRHRRINAELDGLVRERTVELQSRLRQIEEYKDRLELMVREKDDLLADKRLLLKELHHRTKNNLQLIQSLVDLELDQMPMGDDSQVIGKIRNRIRAIAVVHEYLYQAEEFTAINFNTYLNALVVELWDVYRIPGITLDLDIGDDFLLPVDNASAFGIILNELICNSVTHAFDSDDTGKISLKTAVTEDSLDIVFRDTGRGIQDIRRIKEESWHGFELIDALIHQLQGEYILNAEHGTEWIITFPLERVKSS